MREEDQSERWLCAARTAGTAVGSLPFIRSLVLTRSVHKVPAPEPLDVASLTSEILFSRRWPALPPPRLSSQHSPFCYSTTRVQRRQHSVSSVARPLFRVTSLRRLPMTLFPSSSGTKRSPLLQFTGEARLVLVVTKTSVPRKLMQLERTYSFQKCSVYVLQPDYSFRKLEQFD